MNKLTIGIIAFWSGSAVAFVWSHLFENITIEAKETVGILYFLHFVFFLIGLVCLIGRIIQWARSH